MSVISRPSWRTLFAILLCLAIPFLAARPAHAFGVDVCFNAPDSGEPPIRNCIGVEQVCRTSNLSQAQALGCRVAATGDSMSGLTGGNSIVGGRSLVHSDSTYLMAQLLGFTPWQAYQIMIYDEATDQTNYFPFDQNGQQMMTDAEIVSCRLRWGVSMPRKCLLITRIMNGIYKFNDASGGMLLHLHARYSPNGQPPPAIGYPTNYLAGPDAPYEPLLTNLQAWVFDQRPDACVAGILARRGKSCERSGRVLDSPTNYFAAGFTRLQIPFQSNLGRLVVDEKAGQTVVAEDVDLQRFIGPHDVRFAKPGIFLHSLADRFSHHSCTDNSYFYRLASGDYDSYYSPVYCAQGSHFLWHAWEQGTVQDTSNLVPEHQTMQPALDAVYDQLRAYALHRGITLNTAADKATIISDLIDVLEIYDPTSRLDAMVALVERYQALPLPGHGSVANLSLDDWLTLAGAPQRLSIPRQNRRRRDD